MDVQTSGLVWDQAETQVWAGEDAGDGDQLSVISGEVFIYIVTCLHWSLSRREVI